MTTLKTTVAYTDSGSVVVDAINNNTTNSVHPDYRAVTTTPITALVTDQLILADATAGAITINLVAVASAAGKTLTVIKTDSSGNAVTLDGNASETINGSTTHALAAQYNRVRVFCNGTQWLILHA